MNYSNELDMILKKELSNLIDIKRHNVGTFAKGIVENYYLQYQKLKKSK